MKKDLILEVIEKAIEVGDDYEVSYNGDTYYVLNEVWYEERMTDEDDTEERDEFLKYDWITYDYDEYTTYYVTKKSL